MADDSLKSLVKLTGSFGTREVHMVAGRIDEGLSRLTEARVVFAVNDHKFPLDAILGTPMLIELKTLKDAQRPFRGTVVEAEYLGRAQNYDLFAMEIRPWTWFLTRTVNNRIFQDTSVPDIVKAVCDDHGFSDIRFRLSNNYPQRTYVVQYNETDFDFISRMLEEEGIYFYFDHTTTVETMVFGDGLSAHDAIKENADLEYKPGAKDGTQDDEHVYDWADLQRVVPGKVSLVDYNMTRPNTKLGVTQTAKKGKHQKNDMELYRMSGHYQMADEGENYARVAVFSAHQGAQRWAGVSGVRTVAAAGTFKISDLPRPDEKLDCLCVNCRHYLRAEISDDAERMERILDESGLDLPENLGLYQNRFEVMKKTDGYRPPQVTPWPDLSGLHTAVVTGPSGEEIYTDKYGRIKVQFHWDRVGKNDENTTCWVRVVQQWAGKGWGALFIPRIGQEVVIQFERDNPDRPICSGMLYNEVNLPPYELPANKTQSGWKTDSSKGGGGFNELMFEDKKGEELVRFQAEKDYKQIVKNNAEITIGHEKKDPGTLKETVHDSVTEIYGNNHTYTLAHNLTEEVTKGDVYRTLKEGFNCLQMDKGNHLLWQKDGFYQILLEKGDMYVDLEEGNLEVTLNKGDIKVKQNNGKMEVDVSESIEFKTGASSLLMKKDGTIELKGKAITIEAFDTIEAKAGAEFKASGGATAEVKGGAQATLDGGGNAVVKAGIVNIN